MNYSNADDSRKSPPALCVGDEDGLATLLLPLAGHVEGRIFEYLLMMGESLSPRTFHALLLLRLSLPALTL